MKPLTVAWFSFFPVEWLPDAPDTVRALPRMHPASWQRVLLEALEKLAPDLRLHVLILRKQFPRSSSFQRRNVTFHLLRTPAGLRAPSLYWLDTAIIARTLRQVRPDVVQAWGNEQGAGLIATRLRYPHVITIQGLYSWCREVGVVNRHQRLSAWTERRCLPRAMMVTTESTFSADYVRRRFAPRRVEQIEHAPDPIFQQVVRRPRLEPLRLLFIGRFEPQKGVDLLLHALGRLTAELDFELVFVGKPQGALHDELRAELPDELWRRISFKHDLTAPQIAAELAEAAMMIYPTRVDVSPNTVKEAVVAGVPVVASAVGGIPDYVVPGENGLLVESGNLDALVQAIHEASRHPLFGAGQVREDTLAKMRDYLSAERMGRRFLEVYHQIANPGLREQQF